MNSIPLGHLGPRSAHPDQPGGRLLYLPRRAAVVTVGHRRAGGRTCWVVAVNGPRPRDGRIDLTERQLAGARAHLRAREVQDPEVFVLLWKTRLAQRPPGHTERLGRVLADDLRIPGTRTLFLDPATADQLLLRARVLPTALPVALARLVRAGFLDCVTGPPAVYMFTCPTA